MSPEHVTAMNAALQDAVEVRAACAALERPLSLAYRLSDGPAGQQVHWHTLASDTVRFSLNAAKADVVYVGDWSRTVRAMLAAREGRSIDPGMRIEGDLQVLAALAPILQAAAAAATFDVDVPEGLR